MILSIKYMVISPVPEQVFWAGFSSPTVITVKQFYLSAVIIILSSINGTFHDSEP